MNNPLGGDAEPAQFPVGLFLPGIVEQLDHVHFREFGQLAQGLVHEHTAAVNRGADGVRRNEEHAQSLRSGVHGIEAVAEIAAERTQEGFAVAHPGERTGAPSRTRRLRQLEKRAP